MKKVRSDSAVIQHPEIGEIRIVASAAAKYIRISLRPFGGIRVTVPQRASVREAMAFVDAKTDWIRQTQARMAAHENCNTVFMPDDTCTINNRSIRMIPWKSGQFRARLTGDSLMIFYPQEADVRSGSVQNHIRDYIIQMLRKDAKEYLPQRTEQLAAEHGFAYRSVTVKNVTSRWGSCSSVNRINLNIHLMRLPKHLQDYVILHELAHTVHKNHGPRFWQCLHEHTGGKAKLLAKEMKEYDPGKF